MTVVVMMVAGGALVMRIKTVGYNKNTDVHIFATNLCDKRGITLRRTNTVTALRALALSIA